jgi:AP-3 complex subunit beta
VKQLSKLLQDVTVPKARASIVWVIGEYHQHVPLLAPDVLRILAKSFTEEVLCSPALSTAASSLAIADLRMRMSRLNLSSCKR